MNDMIQTLLRSLLKVGGGYLIAKGLTDQAGAEAIIGGVISIVGIILGMVKAKRTAAK